MAFKTLIFGTDELFDELKPFYDREVERGSIEIIAYAVFENGEISLVNAEGKREKIDDFPGFHMAIVSSKSNFYRRMKFLEAQGFPRRNIIDGRVFRVPNLNFSKLLKEGVAHGLSEDSKAFKDTSSTIYPVVYRFKNSKSVVSLGMKSYIDSYALIEGNGALTLGKFTAVDSGSVFEFGLNDSRDYKKVSSFDLNYFDWQTPAEFLPPPGTCRINIGNDVRIGRGCFFKCSNPNKPLVIGDGAVIAPNSIIIKDIPPYAIADGVPAKVIDYRFEPEIIKAFLKIKWWDWSLDKIYSNFKYFNDAEKFISLNNN